MSHPRSYGYGYGVESVVGSLLVLVIVLLVILVYLAFKAILLVARVLMRYPHTRVLWVLLWGSLGFWFLAGACLFLPRHIATPLALLWSTLATLATALLIIVARVVELQHDALLREPPTRQTLVRDVLQRPWWAQEATERR